MLVTSSVKPDMSEIGESVTVIEASTGTVLSTHKISSKPSPAKSAPVEIMFSPKTDPPVVHITNMMEGTLWAGVWDPASKTFSFHQVDDFGLHGHVEGGGWLIRDKKRGVTGQRLRNHGALTLTT